MGANLNTNEAIPFSRDPEGSALPRNAPLRVAAKRGGFATRGDWPHRTRRRSIGSGDRPVQNAVIAAHFDELADLLELQGANPFRVRAYRNAARTLENVSQSIADLCLKPDHDLTEFEGIGKDLAGKIETLVQSGTLPQLEELRAQFPPDVLKMFKIPGLGPKKVAALIDQLHIGSLHDLRAACEGGQVAKLKGFGKKTEESILAGLEQVQQAVQRVLLPIAKAEADAIVADLVKSPVVQKAEVAGSCRRLKETCGDLDLLATSSNPEAAMDLLAEHALVEKVLARGETKQRVRLRSGIELDLRVVPDESTARRWCTSPDRKSTTSSSASGRRNAD
jgi:DNA polymerase (family 10)